MTKLLLKNMSNIVSNNKVGNSRLHFFMKTRTTARLTTEAAVTAAYKDHLGLSVSVHQDMSSLTTQKRARTLMNV